MNGIEDEQYVILCDYYNDLHRNLFRYASDIHLDFIEYDNLGKCIYILDVN